MTNKRFAVLVAAGAATMALAVPAHAENAMQVCGAKYQAAKTSKTLPAGQTWNQFLAQCRASLPKATAATPAPVATTATKVSVAKTTTATTTRTPGQPTAAQQAMYARERQCGAQFKADKAAGKLPAGQKWPQYWSACNKRMK